MFQLKKRKMAIATFDLSGFIKKLDSKYDTIKEAYHNVQLPADRLMLDVETTDSLLVRFAFSAISLEKNQDKIRINSLSADVLSKHK